MGTGSNLALRPNSSSVNWRNPRVGPFPIVYTNTCSIPPLEIYRTQASVRIEEHNGACGRNVPGRSHFSRKTF